jgi:hypothetical protein
MGNWSRNEILAVLSLLVGLVGSLAALIMVPEIRERLGLKADREVAEGQAPASAPTSEPVPGSSPAIAQPQVADSVASQAVEPNTVSQSSGVDPQKSIQDSPPLVQGSDPAREVSSQEPKAPSGDGAAPPSPAEPSVPIQRLELPAGIRKEALAEVKVMIRYRGRRETEALALEQLLSAYGLPVTSEQEIMDDSQQWSRIYYPDCQEEAGRAVRSLLAGRIRLTLMLSRAECNPVLDLVLS